MAQQKSYGEILRNARERKHISISTIAEQLHVRPDLLRAIEEGDFARLPPRGHTRNMVNAYARKLGLNPREITSMYLDEMYVYETGRLRSDERMNSQNAHSRSRTSSRSSSRNSTRNTRTRNEPTRGYGSSYDGGSRRSRSRSSNQSRGVRQGFAGGKTYPSLYSSSQNNASFDFSGIASKLPIIGIAAVILIILIIVVTVVFGNRAPAQEEVPDVPISGLTDTSTPSEGEGGEGSSVEDEAPTYAEFTYKMDEGEAWVEIYVDGETAPETAEVMTGPIDETIEVTGTLTFSTANPTPFTLEVDGEPVELESDGTYYSYTVDFEKILDEWNEDHGIKTSKKKSSSSSSSSSESSSNEEDDESSSSSSSSSRSNSSSSANDEATDNEDDSSDSSTQ